MRGHLCAAKAADEQKAMAEETAATEVGEETTVKAIEEAGEEDSQCLSLFLYFILTSVSLCVYLSHAQTHTDRQQHRCTPSRQTDRHAMLIVITHLRTFV